MTDDQLFLEYRETKDLDLRNQLVEKFYYIAETLSRKFVNRGVDYDDLLQVASFALIKAVERYDVTSGNKFSTFATPTIIGEVKKYFRDKAYTVRVPRKLYEAYPRVKKIHEELSITLGRVPTAKEVSSECHFSEEDVIEILDSAKTSNMISLDESIDDEGFARIDMLGSSETGYIDIENKELYKKAFEKLSQVEQDIIEMRYYEHMSQKNIAIKLNVSQMYVSRLERKIYQKLRLVLNNANKDI